MDKIAEWVARSLTTTVDDYKRIYINPCKDDKIAHWDHEVSRIFRLPVDQYGIVEKVWGEDDISPQIAFHPNLSTQTFDVESQVFSPLGDMYSTIVETLTKDEAISLLGYFHNQGFAVYTDYASM